MTARSLTRASFLAGLAGAGVLAWAPAANAARNPSAEQFVQANATAALRTLADRSVSAAQRQATFTRLMSQFSDMERIAIWVLGRYGRQLRNDPALRREWIATFQDYAIATYEARLDRYSGASIRVTNSRQLEQAVEVTSSVTPPGESRPLEVRWQLYPANGGWKVFDVQVAGVWLAQRQQLELVDALGQHGGDIRALIVDVRGLTASMRQRVVARS